MQDKVPFTWTQLSGIDSNIQADSVTGGVDMVIPNGLYTGVCIDAKASALPIQAVYNGGYTQAKEIQLRIANGGAGQSGLIGAWADAFIKYSVAKGAEPFLVAWYLGDTTESLKLLAAGLIDVAVTYNEAAEIQSLNVRASVQRNYCFRDHFLLVGPKSNPAHLDAKKDDILAMFNKIVTCGDIDVAVPPDPTTRPPTRFLSRFDKSATNIKESELFVAIGQVPWALDYSKWYHQYTQFPLQALEAASLLSEYTVTDRGAWLSSSQSATEKLTIYKAGSDDPKDPLLSPAHALLGAKANPAFKRVWESFMEWVISSDGGQRVVATFTKNGQVLYAPAPK